MEKYGFRDIERLKNYEFINEYKGTRNGFKHTSTLLLGSYEVGTYTANYINRTWECYTFQTSMCGCVRELMDNLKADLKEEFKNIKGISRLTKKYEKELEDYYKTSAVLGDYELMLEELR